MSIDFDTYIDKLTDSVILHPSIPKKINICFSGGGALSFYGYGILVYLGKLFIKNKIQIDKISGTSAGTTCAVILYILMKYHNITTNTLKQIQASICKEYNDDTTKSKTEILINNFASIIPENIYKDINKKLYINSHEVKWYGGLIHTIFDTFESKEDLIHKMKCSCVIPFFTSDTFYYSYNNKKYIDGFIPLNNIFNNDNPVLVIDFSCLNFLRNPILDPNNKYLDSLILDGITDIHLLMSKNINCSTLYFYKKTYYFQIMKYSSFIIILLYIYKKINLKKNINKFIQIINKFINFV